MIYPPEFPKPRSKFTDECYIFGLTRPRVKGKKWSVSEQNAVFKFLRRSVNRILQALVTSSADHISRQKNLCAPHKRYLITKVELPLVRSNFYRIIIRRPYFKSGPGQILWLVCFNWGLDKCTIAKRVLLKNVFLICLVGSIVNFKNAYLAQVTYVI